jgi:hypothetical protein
MKRLMMAGGKTTNAASALNPNEYKTTPISITNPRITPRMKLRLPRYATHGKRPTQAA